MSLIAEEFNVRDLLVGECYKAKIAFVAPQSRRDHFEQESECFLGVSLENRNFTKNRFHSIVEWAARRFDRTKILIGDHIHRITLQSARGLTENEAKVRAKALGIEFIETNRSIVDAYRQMTDFEYVTCSDIQSTSDYTEIHIKLRDYFDSHPKFRESVEGFGRNYHRHDWKKLSEQQQRERLTRSSDYFLEEFAVFACLVKQGCKVMVYPGAFSTLAEIANGDFPDILKELQELTVVSLQLKRR